MKIVDIIEMNEDKPWDKYSKQQLMEAYSVEVVARKDINLELNKTTRDRARLTHTLIQWRDMWVKEHVRHNVKVVGDIEEMIEAFFSNSTRQIFFTDSNGYIGVTEEDDHLFITFAWANIKKLKKELKDMTALLHELVAYGKPVYFTGLTNVLRNHSIEIEPGLWKVTL